MTRSGMTFEYSSSSIRIFQDWDWINKQQGGKIQSNWPSNWGKILKKKKTKTKTKDLLYRAIFQTSIWGLDYFWGQISD